MFSTARAMCLAAMMVCLAAVPAAAQFTTLPNNGDNSTPIIPPGVGGTATGIPQTQLTPQQLQSIMMMRALQGRSRGQVRTGVPQFIPMQPGGMPNPYDGTGFDDGYVPTTRSSAQRRMEARQARAAQKGGGGGGAAGPVDKKAQAEKIKADKKALAEKRAKDAAEKKKAGKKPAKAAT